MCSRGLGWEMVEKRFGYLHNAGLWNVVAFVRVVIVTAVEVAGETPPSVLVGLLGSTVGGSLALDTLLVDYLGAFGADGHFAGFKIVVDLFAVNVMSTFDAGCRSEGSVALDQLLAANSGFCFEVVDVLAEVREKLLLVL